MKYVSSGAKSNRTNNLAQRTAATRSEESTRPLNPFLYQKWVDPETGTEFMWDGQNWVESADGLDAVVATLDNESISIQTDVDGSSGDFTNAFTVFRIFDGQEEVDISGETLSLVDSNTVSNQLGEPGGLGIRVNVTDLTADDGYVRMQLTYNDVVYTKYFNLSRSRTGGGIIYTGVFSNAKTYFNSNLRNDVVLYPIETSTGTTTGLTSLKLIDSGANFTGDGIQIGDIVYNSSGDLSAVVTAVDSAIQLSLSNDIFTTTENYVVGAENYYQFIGTNNTSGPWDSNNWSSFGGTLDAVATDLLLAKDVVITKTLVIGSAVTDGLIKSANYDPEAGIGWAIKHDGDVDFKSGEIGGWSILDGVLEAINEAVIKGGQTDFAVGTGFFLGFSNGEYKFSLGGADNYLRWDGSFLTIKGAVDIGSDGILNLSSFTVANLPVPAVSVGFNSPSADE